MKRIILGLSLFLMLVQNGFADTSEAAYEAYAKTLEFEYDKAGVRCAIESRFHKDRANVDICLKAVKLMKESNNPDAKKKLPGTLIGLGNLYYSSKNYVKAYKYYMESAKLGNTGAQRNLDILCRNHSSVCK